MTLYLSTPEGQDLFLPARRRRRRASSRTSGRARWSAGASAMTGSARPTPRLVLARVTGFGQFGPYARRPGFGTLAEAMSGFAAMTGEPDGPPTLPPFGLADGIAALATAYAVMTALRARDTTAARPGRRPVHHRADPDRARRRSRRSTTSSASCSRAPATGRSTTRRATPTGARRLLGGGLHLGAEHRRAGHAPGRPARADRRAVVRHRRGTGEHADELDEAVGAWVGRARPARRCSPRSRRRRPRSRRSTTCATCWPTRSSRRWTPVTTVDDPELGPLRMQNVLFRLSDTPGAIRWTGRPHGADTDEICCRSWACRPRTSKRCATREWSDAGPPTEMDTTSATSTSRTRHRPPRTSRHDTGRLARAGRDIGCLARACGGSRPAPTFLYAPADRPGPMAKALAGDGRHGHRRSGGRRRPGEQGPRPGGARRAARLPSAARGGQGQRRAHALRPGRSAASRPVLGRPASAVPKVESADDIR